MTDTLLVETDMSCRHSDLEQMRKRIIAQAIDILARNEDHSVFHNHIADQEVWRYPYIHYRSRGKKFVLFAWGKAVPILLKIITHAQTDNKKHLIHINNCRFSKRSASWDGSHRNEYYRLFDWVALNNTTYKSKWMTSFSLLERVEILNQCLTGHLRILASIFIIGKAEESLISGELFSLSKVKSQRIFGNEVLGFNIIF